MGTIDILTGVAAIFTIVAQTSTQEVNEKIEQRLEQTSVQESRREELITWAFERQQRILSTTALNK